MRCNNNDNNVYSRTRYNIAREMLTVILRFDRFIHFSRFHYINLTQYYVCATQTTGALVESYHYNIIVVIELLSFYRIGRARTRVPELITGDNYK